MKTAPFTLPALLCIFTVVVPSVAAAEPCTDRLIEERRSPTGEYVVSILGRVCDGAPGFSTTVALTMHGRPVGTVLLVDINPGKTPAPSGPGGGPRVDASWTDNRNLRLVYHADVKVRRATSFVQGVAIEHIRQWQ
jgi:hypothetical protein